MSYWNLLWIYPLAFVASFVVAYVILEALRRYDDRHLG